MQEGIDWWYSEAPLNKFENITTTVNDITTTVNDTHLSELEFVC